MPNSSETSRCSACGSRTATLGNDPGEAAAKLPRGVEIRTYHADAYPHMYPLLVRNLLVLGKGAEAEGFSDLDDARTPFGAALGRVVAGLLTDDPSRASDILADAIERLETLGVSVERGATLFDLAKAQAGRSVDPTPTLARAREILTASQALGWLPRVEEAEHELSAGA